MLDEVMIEAGQRPDIGFDFEGVSEDGQKILDEYRNLLRSLFLPEMTGFL